MSRSPVVAAPKAKVVLATPEYATAVLEGNGNNRPLRSGVVEKYASDMRAGNWQMNGETVKLDHDGNLLDGQHRLWAVIESGCAIEMLVVEGIDPKVMPTIDTGAVRSMGDVLSLDRLPYAAATAATLRLWHWYLHVRPMAPGTSRPSHSELLRTLKTFPELPARVQQALHSNRVMRILPASVAAFVYSGAAMYDEELANDWITGVTYGEHLSSGSPIAALRDRMMVLNTTRTRKSPTEMISLAMKSWNMFAEGRGVKLLRWQPSEGYPSFYGESKGAARTASKASLSAQKAGKARAETRTAKVKRRPAGRR